MEELAAFANRTGAILFFVGIFGMLAVAIAYAAWMESFQSRVPKLLGLTMFITLVGAYLVLMYH